jgi:hypothetical protein
MSGAETEVNLLEKVRFKIAVNDNLVKPNIAGGRPGECAFYTISSLC